MHLLGIELPLFLDLVQDFVRADIGGEDENGVSAIHNTPFAVRDTPIVQHLEQNIENIMVCFFDLIQKDHRIGVATDRLGQLPTLLITHITRWRPDQF